MNGKHHTQSSWFDRSDGWLVLAILAGVAIVAILVLALSRANNDRDEHLHRRRFIFLVGLLAVLITTMVLAIVFAVPSESVGDRHNVTSRFTLLGDLLKDAALGAISLALVSILLAVLLRPARVRRTVRRCGRDLATAARRDRGHPRRVCELLGGFLLWLTASSLQIKDFVGPTGDAGGPGGPVDPAGVSNAMGAFLRDIGSPTAIGAPSHFDPRLAVAPFQSTTIAQDVEKALSDTPSGAAAAALLSLAQRLVPQERLYVSGYVLRSVQRGPGLTLTIASPDGSVVDSETIWSSDFEPGVLAPKADADVRAVTSPTIVLALAAAVWLTFALARRGRGRDLGREPELGTTSWQSLALVRVGLQGAAQRPRRLTQAIYARAVEADPDNHIAAYNLGLTETRGRDTDDLLTANDGIRRLKRLYGELMRSHATTVPDQLALLIVFNVLVTALNDRHAARRERRSHGVRPADHLRLWAKDLDREVVALETYLDALPPPMPDDPISIDRALREIEKPLLALWAAVAQQLGGPATLKAGAVQSRVTDRKMPAQVSDYRHADLAAALRDHVLGHRDLVRDYLGSHQIDARTRYNLACYWAAAGEVNRALAELRTSLEPGTVGQGADLDPAWYDLRAGHEREFQEVVAAGRLIGAS